MDILNSLFGTTVDRVDQALSLTTQRQALLMNNLANVNVPGYKREDMDFHIHLNEASSRIAQVPGAVTPQGMGDQSNVESTSASVRQDGNSVDMERETMEIAETQMHYQALTTVAANDFSNLKMAIGQ